LSAGPYLLKIYYVYTNQAPEDGRTINAERRMRVIVNGAVILRDQVFSPVSTITELNVNVTLRAGSNTVRLTHPDFECPAVDRIEIFSL
jgi:archaellin